MSAPILLTGATGNTGQVVAELLQRRGVPIVGMVRSEANRRRLAERGVPTVHGDFDDPASLRRALAGIETAYLVCTPDERLAPRETAFVRAAVEVGVKRIVKGSAYWAGLAAPTQNLRSNAHVERELAASGLEWTVLRPIGFMQTFTLFGWNLIDRAGVLTLPAGDGGMAMIDVRDVAAAAVLALTEPGHAGKSYDLTGPEVLTMSQIADTLARVLGKPVTYIEGGEVQLKLVMRLLGVTPVPTEHVVTIFRLQREHKFEETRPTLQQLGITPTTYEQFVRDLVAGRTGGGNSFKPPETAVTRVLDRVMPPLLRTYLRLRGR